MIIDSFFILFMIFIKNALYGFKLDINLFEGDILGIPVGSNRTKRGAVDITVKKWPGGIVPYLIDTEFNNDHRNIIQKALKEISDVTGQCIKFVSRTNQNDYVKIVNGHNCSSYVGKQNGIQVLNLAISGCVYNRIVIHEFLHALGMLHEQSRPDRDNYIKVLYENIMPEEQYNFNKYSIHEIDISQPYDYESIMHYSTYAFSKNGKETIVSLTNKQIKNDASSMSKIDIMELKTMYKCSSEIIWQPGNWALGCDFKNNDLSNVKTTGANCGQSCNNNPQCTHFTWTNYNGGTCWLKYGSISKNDAFKTNDNSIICGIVRTIAPGPSIIWQPGNWALGCDFKNNDLSNVKTTGANCGQTCYNNPKCTHFTWTNYNGGTCWLKYGSISKTDAFKTNDNSMVCGIVRTIAPGPSIIWQPGNWAFGCDFKNNDLSNVKTTGANCGQTCYNNPKCTHFTWTKYNGGTCWLKYGSISKTDAFKTNDNSMVCGIVRS